MATSRDRLLRLMGGAALILAYEMARSTEDVDLLQDDDEALHLVQGTNFGEALDATNRELAPEGLYLSHIWGPEQQILTPTWRGNCRSLELPGLKHVRLQGLGPLDLIVRKLCRADAGDLRDFHHLFHHEALSPQDVRDAIRTAIVPAEFVDVFAANALKVTRDLG